MELATFQLNLVGTHENPSRINGIICGDSYNYSMQMLITRKRLIIQLWDYLTN